jgi:hypothetical protein
MTSSAISAKHSRTAALKERGPQRRLSPKSVWKLVSKIIPYLKDTQNWTRLRGQGCVFCRIFVFSGPPTHARAV